MISVYDAENNIEAHMIVHLLKRSGIDAQIMGEHLQGGVGELPAHGNIRVVVEESDETEARRIISMWESEETPSGEAPPVSARKGTYSGFFGFLAGGVIASVFWLWAYNSPIDWESADYDGDGIEDEFYQWRGGFTTLIEGDRNGDGEIDVRHHFSRRLGIDRSESDNDFNGSFEYQTRYRHSEFFEDRVDINDDGLPDRTYHYVDGVLARSELVHPSRRYLRKEEQYEHGVLKTAHWDSDDDGALDTFIEYDLYGEEVSRSSSGQTPIDAQTARLRATIDEDIETLARYLSDDLTYSHNTGWIETKAEYLATVESKTLDYVSAVPRDVEVRIYGDIAVLTGLADMTGLIRGEPVELTIRFLEVSRRAGDSWQLTAWQSVKYDSNESPRAET
ncbi:MAG: DUF2007 domain-containing protein [Gammaproteobacteria bacterium]|nr:DUF2007 domain-containing protein [Gammaproteobacteria bacterium]